MGRGVIARFEGGRRIEGVGLEVAPIGGRAVVPPAHAGRALAGGTMWPRGTIGWSAMRVLITTNM